MTSLLSVHAVRQRNGWIFSTMLASLLVVVLVVATYGATLVA